VDEVAELQPGEPLTFVATVETRPAIELRNIRDFDLPDPSVEPGTLEIDEMVDSLRRQVAPWVEVARPAGRGDQASLEITTLASPEHPEEKTDNVAIEVGDPAVWEELSLAVSGLAAGQEAGFERKHEHPPAAGATEGEPPVVHEQRFRVKVTAVKERELPPADDALAAKVTQDLTTLEALREAIGRQLREQKAAERRERRQRALLDQLRERHPLDLPQGVVRREVSGLVQDYAEGLARRGVDVEHAGVDWNHLAEEFAPLAERRVHARLLLDAVAEAESVAVTEEEFERALAGIARAQNTSTPALRKALDEDGRLAALRLQMRRDKTIRRLLGESDGRSAVASLPRADVE
jgi:trigger factor